MSTWEWIFLSGIPSSHPGGTGQLMKYLERSILEANRFDGTVLYSADEEGLSDEQIELVVSATNVTIFHPQTIGSDPTLDIIRQRQDSGRQTKVYLLDNVFFCRRSYNHIDTETQPCHRCVGSRDFAEAQQMGCIPWPKAERDAASFASHLIELVNTGAVSFYAQTQTQVNLARQHFGGNIHIDLVGLWCDDWQEHFLRFEEYGVFDGDRGRYDVVYHGSRDFAKGLAWLLSVAHHTPNLTFLVPLDRGNANFSGPSNVTIQPMRWDEGLFEAVKGAALTLVPSLWSAPCEGALVKSLLTARATGVVENSTSFSNEIPNDVVLRLPSDPVRASQDIIEAVQHAWRPDAAKRTDWLKDFAAFNKGLARRLIDSPSV